MVHVVHPHFPELLRLPLHRNTEALELFDLLGASHPPFLCLPSSGQPVVEQLRNKPLQRVRTRLLGIVRLGLVNLI